MQRTQSRGRAWPPRPCARAGRRGRRGGPPREHGARRSPARSSGSARAPLDQPPEVGVGDLAGQVLEEAVELVEVAVGHAAGSPTGRPRRRAARAIDSSSTWRASRKRSTRPATVHEVPPLEAGGEEVGVAEGAGLDLAGAVAQPHREVGRARARGEAVLARAGEDALHPRAGAQAGDGGSGRGDAHPESMPELPDAPARKAGTGRYGVPMDYVSFSDRPALRRPRHGLRLQGLERRRGVGHGGARLPRREFEATEIAPDRPGGVLRLHGRAAHRPLSEGLSRVIDWPENVLLAASVEGAERDLVLLQGVEPSLKWRGFYAGGRRGRREAGREMVITLGALLADVPHTRPVSITGLASDDDLIERLGFERSRYEGPTGIVGVLHDTCAARRASLGQPVGRRAALRRRRAQPEGRAGARAPLRGRAPASPWTPPRSSRRPRTTSARSAPPWRATPTSRPSSSGSRRRSTRRWTTSPSGPSPRRRDRARLPALPAPARPRGLSAPGGRG